MSTYSLSDSWLKKYFSAGNLKKDFPSSIVVFLVALPLCLGIALASGAPLFSGIVTGIIGGVVVAAISGSQLSVSGPAAGLTVIVLTAIGKLGSYEAFILAVVLAGALQLVFGLLRAGIVANYFPSSVIEGMLAAIGIILIIKQVPHAVGYNATAAGSANILASVGAVFSQINYGAVAISLVSILIMIYWPKMKKLSLLPAPLLVVVAGVLSVQALSGTPMAIMPDQRVSIPVVHSLAEFTNLFTFPDFGRILDVEVWVTAATIAIVASLETLLSLEAVDKIDPLKRVSPTNRELVAQGIGNMSSGMLGGLPLTAVIVRSSANVNAGGKTKVSAMLHGVWLLLSLLFIPAIINLVPLSCLAAILLITGYKLANLSLFKKMWQKGKDQFVPFIVTVLAVVFTDLLTGVTIGMFVGVAFILRTNLRNPYFYSIERKGDQRAIRIKLAEEVTFLNKAAIQHTFMHLPDRAHVIVDGKRSKYIDNDVLEVIHNFQNNASSKGTIVQLEGIQQRYEMPKLRKMIYKPENITNYEDLTCK